MLVPCFAVNLILIKKIVLNIGCGFGWFELFAATFGVKKITGMEISDDDLKTAKKILGCLMLSLRKAMLLKFHLKINHLIHVS